MIHQEAQLPKLPDHAKYLFFSGQPRMLVEFLTAHRDPTRSDITSLTSLRLSLNEPECSLTVSVVITDKI